MTPWTAIPLAAILAGARCEEEVRGKLDLWGARTDAVYPGASDPTGARTVLLPTRTLGVWVRLTVDPRGEARVERVTEALVEGRWFGRGCETMDAGREERTIAVGPWTDAALSERLREGDRGVILLWSPHMPLSVDAYPVLQALTREMGIGFVPMLDPTSNAAYARTVALERGMPAEALRPLGGVELAFRGMTTHAPSLQVFKGGQLQGPVVPGYRDRAGYRLSIERWLGARP
jgi:hypothetical protein